MKKQILLTLVISILCFNMISAVNVQFYYKIGATDLSKSILKTIFDKQLTPAQKTQFNSNKPITLTIPQKINLKIPNATSNQITKNKPVIAKPVIAKPPIVTKSSTPDWKPISVEYTVKKSIATEYLKSFLGTKYSAFQKGQAVSIYGKQKLLGFPEHVKTIKKSK